MPTPALPETGGPAPQGPAPAGRPPARRRPRLLARAAALVAAGTLAATALAAGPAAPAGADEVAPRPLVSGWYGWWTDQADVADLAANAGGVVPEVNIFWWAFSGAGRPLCTYDSDDADRDRRRGDCLDGSATPWTTPHLAAQAAALHAAGIKVYGSLTDLGNGRERQLTAYLSSASRRAAYANKIAAWAQAAGVDGVDLDWENFAFHDGRGTWTATKARWVAFIRVLSSALHARGLALSATVPGGYTAFAPDGSPNPGTGYWVYAWKDIAPHVDRLRIMAYDYHMTNPGPIGPNDWAERLVASAVAQVGAENAGKVWIGQPQYGRDWVDRDPATGRYLTSGCPASWQPTASTVNGRVTVVRPGPAAARAAAYGVVPQLDAASGEFTFRYTTSAPGTYSSGGRRVARTCTVQRVVWYGGTDSALARASLVTRYGIGGIAVWNLEDVVGDFYPRLADYGRSVAPAAPVAPAAGTQVSAAVSGRVVIGDTTTVVARVRSGGRPVAGAAVALAWRKEGTRTWATVAHGRTGADGKVRWTVRPGATGTWRVAVAAGPARRAAVHVAGTTLVRARVVARPAAAAVRAGTGVRVYGQVVPGRSGVVVRAERRTARGWVAAGSARTDSLGRVSVPAVLPVAGTVQLRLVSASSRTLAAGYSAVVRVAAR